MTSSDEFVNELNRIAHQYNPRVHFGISYSEMKNPNGQKAKNWKDAIKAILLETNESHHREATDIALRIFPGKRYPGHKRIWGMNLLFVYDCNHEDVENLDIAQRNISTLINRQQVHSKFELMTSNNRLLPKVMNHAVFKRSNETLRDTLMGIKSKTTKGCEGGQLFSSILYSDYKKKKEYWFFYHKKVKKEAEAVVRALPAMLKYEYSIAIDHFFYEGSLDDADEWNPDTRTLRNAITIATDNMLAGTEDLITEGEGEGDEEIEINEDQSIAMNSLEQRECDRVMNLDDEETILNPKKKKKMKPKTAKKTATKAPEVIALDEDQSQMGSLAGSSLGMNSATASLTPSKSKAFRRETLAEANNIVTERLKVQREEYDKKLKESEERAKEMARHVERMSAAIAHLGIDLPPNTDNNTTGSGAETATTQHSGENSDESNIPNQEDIPSGNPASPPHPLGLPVEHGEDFDWNAGADADHAEEELEKEKEELRKLDRDRKRLEKEKARLLRLQRMSDKREEDVDDQSNSTYYSNGSQEYEYGSDEEGEEEEYSDRDEDEYGEDASSSDTSRSGSISGYDDKDKDSSSSSPPTSSSGSSSSSSSSSGSGSEESTFSNSDEDITNSVQVASSQSVATGGDPGGSD